MSRILGQVTKHTVGSFKELLSVSLPLIMSSGSSSIMIFVDRWFLGRLSTESFAAASEAAILFVMFVSSVIVLVTSSEVLVGRLFGSGQNKSVSRPVWVMIWLSILSSIFFVPVALFGTHYLFQGSSYRELSEEFFKYLTVFGPMFLLNHALSSFWIGRGKTTFVTVINIGSNLFNILLDALFIFGFKGFPALGIKGAGLATGISQILACSFFFFAFLKKKYRDRYNTSDSTFDKGIFQEAIALGFPLFLNIFFQSAAWSAIARMMSISSGSLLLVWGLNHTMYLLFQCIGRGVSRAVTTISSNVIGADRHKELSQIIRSGILFHTGYFVVLMALFSIFLVPFIEMLIPDFSHLSKDLQVSLKAAFLVNGGILLFDALGGLFWGVLIAMKDSTFVMLSSTLMVWVFSTIPAYLLINSGYSGAHVYLVILGYYALSSFVYFARTRYLLNFRGSLSVPE